MIGEFYSARTTDKDGLMASDEMVETVDGNKRTVRPIELTKFLDVTTRRMADEVAA